MNFITKFICKIFDLVDEDQYKKLQNSYSELEIQKNIIESRATTLQVDNTQLKQKNDALVSELKLNGEKLAEAENIIESKNNEIDELNKEISTLNKKYNELSTEKDIIIKESQAKEDELNSKIKELEEQLAGCVDGSVIIELTKQVEELTEKNKELETSLNSALNDLNAIKNENTNLNQSIKDLNTKYQELINEHNECVAELTISQEKLNKLESDYNELNTTYTKVIADNRALLLQLEDANKRIKELEEQLEQNTTTATVTVIPNEETNVFINGKLASRKNIFPIGTKLNIEGVAKNPEDGKVVVLKVSEDCETSGEEDKIEKESPQLNKSSKKKRKH